MSPLAKGLIVAAAQLLLVSAVGAKFLVDRDRYPRLWVETAPFDPELPIRGRYVSIALRVDVVRSAAPAGGGSGPAMFLAWLQDRDGRLVAVEDDAGRHWVRSAACGERSCWLLSAPVAYFISEHAADPSRRAAGETLWVEVTLPPTGAPRPIRLGVAKAGRLVPLEE